MRTLLAFLAGAFALASLSAAAANRNGPGLSEPVAMLGGTTHNVGISGFTYTPNDLTIQVGDSVAFAASGTHPLRSDDESFSCDTNCTQTFDTPGEFRYYCDNHGGAGGQGMSGIIRVVGGTTHQVTISGFTYTPNTLTIPVGDSVAFAASGMHPLRSDDDIFSCDANCTQTFNTPGEFRYYCDNHGGPGGSGMSGIVIVQAAAGPVIGVDQTSLSGTVAAGSSTAAAFAISNTGTAELTWDADTAETDCATPGTVPWLTLAPTSGSIAVGAAATPVDVTLDAATLAVGVYTANVCVRSNDPAQDLVALPVEFTVTASDTIFENGFDGTPE